MPFLCWKKIKEIVGCIAPRPGIAWMEAPSVLLLCIRKPSGRSSSNHYSYHRKLSSSLIDKSWQKVCGSAQKFVTLLCCAAWHLTLRTCWWILPLSLDLTSCHQSIWKNHLVMGAVEQLSPSLLISIALIRLWWGGWPLPFCAAPIEQPCHNRSVLNFQLPDLGKKALTGLSYKDNTI